ncbi:hypothetical protein JQ612_01225 [Bradyrhizobium manausense]|uniref:hypothetical protein n=1 Tax=Bradyrhizobium manausense TaxID=989370 RepID=UPI001BA69E25|nr:hypothetical protein [Bradyrhizobium manausense]MBR0831796.1 hypothetical protein [Bradyrhizobium manausense]
MITQLADDFRFLGPPMDLCTLTVRVTDLADRFGFALIHWDDDGLGRAASFFVKLESGRAVLLTEHAHLIERQRAKGPLVEVDARDVADIGVTPLVDEVLNGFQLSREDVDWIAPVDEAYVRDWVRQWADYLARRDRSADGDSSK